MKGFDLLRKVINFKLNAGMLVLCIMFALNFNEFVPNQLSFPMKTLVASLIALIGIFIYAVFYSLLNDIIVGAHIYYNKAHEQIRRKQHVSQLTFDIQTPLKGITTTQLAIFVNCLPKKDKEEFHRSLKALEESS